MRNFTTEDDDSMEAMNKDDIYRYLGHMQSEQINPLMLELNPSEQRYLPESFTWDFEF